MDRSRMSDVWIITAECGDYYCGCGVGHLLGIATTEAEAERIRLEGERAEHSYGADRWRPTFHGVMIDRVTVDELRHLQAQTWAGDVKLRLRATVA